MKQAIAVCVLVLGFLGANAQEASAQVNIFLYLSGIRGTSLDPYHEEWIEVQSLRQTQAPDAPKNNPCQVEILKALDIAGPQLWKSAVTGQHHMRAVIEVVPAVQQSYLPLYKIVFDAVQVAGITTEGSSAFVERVTLVAGGLATLSYYPTRLDGSPGAAVTETFRCD